MPDIEPVEPHEAGVAEDPPELTEIEGARLLARDARPRLHDQGFNDRQIDEWADAYVRQVGAGDANGFVDWVAEQQRN